MTVKQATGEKGLDGRIAEHLDPDYCKRNPGRFHTLLHDGKDREVVWLYPFRIKGSQGQADDDVRTHNRLLSALMEAFYHDIFNSWFDPTRRRYPAWGGEIPVWEGTNFGHPLTGTMLKFAASNIDLRKARKAVMKKRSRQKMDPAERRKKMDKFNAYRREKRARMSPEELGAFNDKNKAARHKREADETPAEKKLRREREMGGTGSVGLGRWGRWGHFGGDPPEGDVGS